MQLVGTYENMQIGKFDIYSALSIVVSSAFGPALAPLISAYGVIGMGWVLGAMVGIFVRRQGLPVIAYLAMSALVSLLLTGWAASFVGGESAAVWLAPISATLAAFTDKIAEPMGAVWARIKGVAKGSQ